MRCLDTNVVIAVLNDRPRDVSVRFDELAPLGELALPAIVVFSNSNGVLRRVTSDV